VSVVAVGRGQLVAEVLPEIERMTGDPRPALERAQVCKRDGRLFCRPTAAPAADGSGRPLWQKLTVHTSESDLHDGQPIHRAIVARLHHLPGGRGATVLRGAWGFHGDQEPHGDKLFELGRQVPVATIVVDGPERIAASFDVIDELTTRSGVVTTELVPALVSIDGGERRGGTALGSFDS
jgi:PII-like signaling protein